MDETRLEMELYKLHSEVKTLSDALTKAIHRQSDIIQASEEYIEEFRTYKVYLDEDIRASKERSDRIKSIVDKLMSGALWALMMFVGGAVYSAVKHNIGQ